MKKFLKPVLVMVIYAVMQGVVGGTMGLLAVITDENFVKAAMSNDTTAVMNAIPMWSIALSVIVAGVLTIVVASAMKLIDWKRTFRWSKTQVKQAWLPLIAALVAIVAIDIATAMCNLDNLLADTFQNMSHDVLGILSVALLGPIIEELCFREAIEGSMLRSGVKPWVAIVVSALLFGLIHGNPVQMVFGALMGVVLGVIYYKTGNIVLTCIVHVLNNSWSVLMMATGGTEVPDWLDTTAGMLVTAAVCTLAAVALFALWWKKTPAPETLPPTFTPQP